MRRWSWGPTAGGALCPVSVDPAVVRALGWRRRRLSRMQEEHRQVCSFGSTGMTLVDVAGLQDCSSLNQVFLYN
jgi:hypothetical protein